jgi:hypothetical protein
MRSIPGVAGLVLAGAAVLSLSACVPPTPRVIPTAEPTVPPVFASADEALAAAKKAYEGYLAVSDAVARDGGRQPERFATVVTADWLPREEASAASLVESNRKQVGTTTADRLRLEQFEQTGAQVYVALYACLDLSSVSFVDNRSGKKVVQPTAVHIPVEVQLSSSGSSSHVLLVERNSPWTGEDFCSR